MIKKWHLNLSLAFKLAVVALLLTFGFPMLSEMIGGRKYAPSQAGDLSALRRLIYQCEPLHQALENHRQVHSSYPKELKELSFPYLHYEQEVIAVGMSKNPIYYTAEHGSGYRLHLKLNWDASLSYDSADREWVYDPGDGSKIADIEP
jgi:hypothetical protein